MGIFRPMSACALKENDILFLYVYLAHLYQIININYLYNNLYNIVPSMRVRRASRYKNTARSLLNTYHIYYI